MRRTNLLILILAVASAGVVSAQEPAETLNAAYQEVEAYRNSKQGQWKYRGPSEDKTLQKWLDLIWNEGWVRRTGFHVNPVALKRDIVHGTSEKKNQALSDLNELTELIFADGSVGNVRNKLWALSSSVERLTYRDNRVQLVFGNSDGQEYALEVRCFEGGLVHVVGQKPGHFDDEGLMPAKISFKESNGILEVRDQNARMAIYIRSQPFAMKVVKNGALKFHQTGFNVAGPPSDPRGVRVRFQASDSDQYLGFGERFDTLNHKHSVFAQWSKGMAEALSHGASETYKPIPFYLNPVNSTGMFYNHGGIVRWDMEGSEPDVVDVSSVGSTCDYFLFAGDHPYDIYRAYTGVTGRIFAVADWVHITTNAPKL